MLVRRQAKLAAPLLPVDLLRVPLFALSVAGSIGCFAAQGLAYVAMPFLLQNTLGFDQVRTGLLLTPWPLCVALISPVSGLLADRFSAAALGGLGLVVMAAGLALMAMLPGHPSELAIVWRDGGVWARVRVLQLAEQPGDDRVRSGAPERWGERDGGDGAAAGSDDGRGVGGIVLRGGAAGWGAGGVVVGGGLRGGGGAGELPAAGCVEPGVQRTTVSCWVRGKAPVFTFRLRGTTLTP